MKRGHCGEDPWTQANQCRNVLRRVAADEWACGAILPSEQRAPEAPKCHPNSRWPFSGTEEVPQRTCATKILLSSWVNFLVRFASKPFFYWVVPLNCSENYLALFGRFFWPCGSCLTLDIPHGPVIAKNKLNKVAWARWLTHVLECPFVWHMFALVSVSGVTIAAL